VSSFGFVCCLKQHTTFGPLPFGGGSNAHCKIC
jgi:hypothetical protein